MHPSLKVPYKTREERRSEQWARAAAESLAELRAAWEHYKVLAARHEANRYSEENPYAVEVRAKLLGGVI